MPEDVVKSLLDVSVFEKGINTMKKTYVRALALCLSVLLLAASLFSCGNSGKTMMSIGGQELSVNMYQLMLSRYRGTMEYSYPEAAQDQFWDIVIDSNGTTYNDYFTASIYEDAKTYVCAMYVFEEIEKLELPKGTLDVIDEEMEKISKHFVIEVYGFFNNACKENAMEVELKEMLFQFLVNSKWKSITHYVI